MEAVDLQKRRICMTQDTLRACEKLLQASGSHGIEGLVLVAGYPEEDRIILDRVYFPRQRGTPISVRLLPGSLIPIHQDLAEQGRLIAVQIHTHPGDAFHTNTDDSDTTVTQLGSISIVAPYFAAAGLNGWPDCVAYILGTNGWSTPTHPTEALQVIL